MCSRTQDKCLEVQLQANGKLAGSAIPPLILMPETEISFPYIFDL